MWLKKSNLSIILAFTLISSSILSAFWAFSSNAEKPKFDLVDMNLPDIDGKPRQLSEFRGKWVVVNFWATWCPPCITEIPELVDFHERHKNKDAVVVGIDFEDIETKELREFIDSYFMSYTILRMKPVSKTQLGLITGLPTSFLISPKGELMARNTGMMTAKMIEEFIAESQNEELQQNAPAGQQAMSAKEAKKELVKVK